MVAKEHSEEDTDLGPSLAGSQRPTSVTADPPCFLLCKGKYTPKDCREDHTKQQMTNTTESSIKVTTKTRTDKSNKVKLTRIWNMGDGKREKKERD